MCICLVLLDCMRLLVFSVVRCLRVEGRVMLSGWVRFDIEVGLWFSWLIMVWWLLLVRVVNRWLRWVVLVEEEVCGEGMV